MMTLKRDGSLPSTSTHDCHGTSTVIRLSSHRTMSPFCAPDQDSTSGFKYWNFTESKVCFTEIGVQKISFVVEGHGNCSVIGSAPQLN